MKRSSFIASGGAVALSACSGHGAGVVPAAPQPVAATAATSAPVVSSSLSATWPEKALPQFPIIGEAFRFDGAVAPTGWMFCDGSVLKIAFAPQLHAVLGSGESGDGKTTFSLPKLSAARLVIAVAGIAPTNPSAVSEALRARTSLKK